MIGSRAPGLELSGLPGLLSSKHELGGDDPAPRADADRRDYDPPRGTDGCAPAAHDGARQRARRARAPARRTAGAVALHARTPDAQPQVRAADPASGPPQAALAG